MIYAHRAEGARTSLIACRDGEARSLTGLAGIECLDDLIAAGPERWAESELLAATSESQPMPPADELKAPLLRPSKIVCIGLNYHDHATEQGLELPARPLVFAKFPSTITGPRETVSWSPEVTEQVDWEAELGVVVGRRLRDVGPEEALTGVFGYTAANDLSARDVQFADGQWVRGKSLDGFLPLGPVLVTADELSDPGALAIEARVNGELMQQSSTDNLIFPIGEVLSFLSRSFTLEPGDLVLTGTPAGVGAFRQPPRFLGSGDVVEIEIEGIGLIRNEMLASGDDAETPATCGDNAA